MVKQTRDDNLKHRYVNKTVELEFSSINNLMFTFTSQQTLKLCLRLTSFSCIEMFILLNFGFCVEYEVLLLNSRRTGETLDSLSQLTVESSEDCI